MSAFYLFILYMLLLADECNGSIHDKVSYHEVIPSHETLIRSRRHAGKGQIDDMFGKEFTFTAFNKTFNCHLRPRTDFFSPTFKLEVYGADGVAREHKFRRDNILVGSCDGDPNSEIRGFFKVGLFTGSLEYNGEKYGLEDAERHVSIPKSSDHLQQHMIMYRTADMKWDQQPKKNGHGSSFCGNDHEEDHLSAKDTSDILVDSVIPENLRRHRRSTVPTWNTCSVIAVADYKFFQSTGQGDIYETALYITAVMDKVDTIFRSTQWSVGSSITGLGFEIAKMRVYEAPTAGFNQNYNTWRPLALLESFSDDYTLSSYCAAHLFTHQAFTGNVLGLAYIAPARAGGLGGICSPIQEDPQRSFNTGWSSTRNRNNQAILMQQANLVTAHELGHNWGSEHDPESGGCAPSGFFNDGKYLMYPYSVSGYDSNNYEFSSCSRAYISRVLSLKGASCLQAKAYDENQLCGNGRLDSGEECDAGLVGRLGLDKCCDNQCQLVSGATCSPINKECCTDCQPSTVGTVCRGETGVDCVETAYCDGTSLNCPRGRNKTSGSCLDGGSCRNGACLDFCAYRGRKSCACNQLASSCLRCCRPISGGECVPHNETQILPDGRPCVGGFCRQGQCEAGSASTVQRLFDVLENISVDGIVEFFRNNIVGSVIVFSLLLWIPCSVIISFLDHRRRNRLDRSENIDVRMNRTLTFDEDKRKVEIIGTPAHRSRGLTSPRYRNANFTDLGGFGSDA